MVLLAGIMVAVFYGIGAKLTGHDFNKPIWAQSKNIETNSSTPIYHSSISETDLQDNFSKVSWRDMEELVGELFRKKGYAVEVTQASGDYGIDVWAKKDGMTTGIQVKKWKKDVGFDDVAKTLGSNLNKANKYIVISTTSFFTNQAWEHQRQHATVMELWDTNRFRQELRENFVQIPKPKQSGGFVHDDKIDSFDYDQGFNIDEVYDSPDEEFGKKCTRCGNLVHREFCGNCGKEVNSTIEENQAQTQKENDVTVCKYCGYEMGKDSALCGKCGRMID